MWFLNEFISLGYIQYLLFHSINQYKFPLSKIKANGKMYEHLEFPIQKPNFTAEF